MAKSSLPIIQTYDPGPDPLVPPVTPYSLLMASTYRLQDDIVIDEDTMQLSRREVRRDVNLLSRAFLELGVKEGDVVMTYNGRSMYSTVLTFYALNRIGAVACVRDQSVPLNLIIEDLAEFRSPVLFVYNRSEKWLSDLRHKLQEKAPSVKHVVNLLPPRPKQNFYYTVLETFRDRELSLAAIGTAYKGKVPSHILDLDREALISYTSGSTSGPKPMVFTNRAMIASAIYSQQAAGLDLWDKVLHSWMSYVHLDCPYGLVVSILAPFCGGGKIVFTPNISRYGAAYYLNKNPNVIFGVPRFLAQLPKLMDDSVNLTDLKMVACGGERLEESVIIDLKDALARRGLTNVAISDGYGDGEVLGLISTAVGKVKRRPGTVGKIPPGAHVVILKDPSDPTSIILEPNQQGFICVYGLHMLNRYYNRPDLDTEKFVEIGGRRYINTGDLGYITPDGYIRLIGRATFFMNDRNYKIYYEIVRTAVAQAPEVKQSYVVKGPHPTLGLASYAFVVLHDGVEANDQTRAAIIEASKQPFQLGDAKQTLAPHEVPYKVIFLDELPTTDAEKTDFHALEKMAAKLGKRDQATYEASLGASRR